MKRIIITGLILIASLAGIVYALNKNKAKNEAETAIVAEQNTAVAVRSSIADVKEVSVTYTTNGTFAPKQEVMLSAETSGRVTKVLVEEGARVRAGQVLAIIDGDKQNVNLNNAQVVFNNAQTELARFESAFTTGGVTQQQLDQARLQFENAKNALQSAKLTVADVNIKASFPGVINKRNIEPGSFVSPGQALFEVVNVSSLKLKISVDEKNIGSIQLGQTVKVKSPVLTNQDFEGKITFIAPKADASLNFPVELEIQNNERNDLRAGMYGTAYIGDGEKTEALVVPRNAFVGSVSSNEVFIIKDGKAVLTTVTSGRSFGDTIEILSGLQKGDLVITSGQINLLDGTPVEVIH